VATSLPATSVIIPDRQPHILVLSVTGTASVSSTDIEYVVDENSGGAYWVRLPWRRSVTVPADGRSHSWSLEVKYEGSGGLSVVAIMDGKVLTQRDLAVSENSSPGRIVVKGSTRP
jgi:hypothetical protein